MRGLGVWLVGLGVTLLVMCVFPVAAAKTTGELLGWLACAGLVPGSLIWIGVALIRRAEGRVEDAGPPPDGAGPAGLLDRVRDFDLNRMNWLGWLLLLGTFGFVLAEVAALVWVWPGGWDRGLAKLAALPMLFLAVGFFAGTRWLLGRFGVSISRRPNSEPMRSPRDTT